MTDQYLAPCCGKKDIPPDATVLLCPFDGQPLGLFRPKELSAPVQAGMFSSLCDWHKFPPPFQDTPGREGALTWKEVKCPYCGKFVFVDRTSGDHVATITTPHGQFEIGSSDIPHALTLEERNQAEIDRIFAEEEEEEEDQEEPVPDPQDNLVETLPDSVPETRNEAILRLSKEGKTNVEIADGFGISSGRVSQIIAKMRKRKKRGQNA